MERSRAHDIAIVVVAVLAVLAVAILAALRIEVPEVLTILLASVTAYFFGSALLRSRDGRRDGDGK